jgi:hypothetical protein
VKLGNQQQNRAGNGHRVNITRLLGGGIRICVSLDEIQAMRSEYQSPEGAGVVLRCWKHLASVVRASCYVTTVGHDDITISRSRRLRQLPVREPDFLDVRGLDRPGGSSHSKSGYRNYY